MAKSPAAKDLPSNVVFTLKKLTDLFVMAYELITRGQRKERCVQELIFALELFRDNKLEGVVLFEGDDSMTEGARRRAEFKKRLTAEGPDLLWREFLERIPRFAQKRIRELSRYRIEDGEKPFDSFRDLIMSKDSVGMPEFYASRGILKKVEEALSVYGLYRKMSKAEVEAIFGPAPKK